MIVKDGVVYVFGEIFSKVAPFLLVPYLTRVLGVEEYGHLGILMSIAAVLFALCNLSQHAAMSRYYIKYSSLRNEQIKISGECLSLVILLLLCPVLYFYFGFSGVVCALYAFSQIVISNELSIRQIKKKVFSYASIQFSLGVLSVLVTLAIFYFFEPSPQLRVFSLFITYFAVSIFVFDCKLTFYRFKKSKFIFYIKYVCGFGLPLVVHNLSYILKSQVDRFFVWKIYDANSLGLYSAALQLGTIYQILIIAINKAVMPYFYEWIKSGRLDVRKIKNISIVSLFVGVFPYILVLFIPESFFTFLLGDGYSGVKEIFANFMLTNATLVFYLSLSHFYFFYGKTAFISKVTLTSFFLYIFLLVIIWFFKLETNIIPLASALSNLLAGALLFYKLQDTQIEFGDRNASGC